MSGYLLTAPARTDVLEIWEYIADEDGVDRADHVATELEAAMRRLAEMPGMGHSRDDLGDESLRAWPVWSFLIIYRPETQPLQVIRVLHGSRDLNAIFRS